MSEWGAASAVVVGLALGLLARFLILRAQRRALAARDDFWFRLIDEECHLEHEGYFGSWNVTSARYAIRDEHNELERLNDENDRLREALAARGTNRAQPQDSPSTESGT